MEHTRLDRIEIRGRTAAVVDKHSDGRRKIVLPFKDVNRSQLSVLVEFEVVQPEIRHVPPLLVLDGGKHVDEVDVDRDGRLQRPPSHKSYQ